MNPRPSEDQPQSTLYSAKLGRVGGSRWGWVLRIEFPCPPVCVASRYFE